MDAPDPALSAPWLTVSAELDRVLRDIDEASFAALLAEFTDADRGWFFTGQGRSGLSAKMAAMRLMHLGRRVHVVGEVTAPSVRAGDTLVVLSGSGGTPVSLSFATIAKSEGARIVAVTAQPHSALAELADLCFTVPTTQSQQFGGSLFEQASLLVLDAVMLALAGDDSGPRMARLHTNLQ